MPEDVVSALLYRASQTQHGFGDVQKAAAEVVAQYPESEALTIAHNLYARPVHQARMLAVFILGAFSTKYPPVLGFLRYKVSRDEDWRVQEILAKAFDRFCADTGYDIALPEIEDWLRDPYPNVRRATSEGLRIWTARPYFRDHPATAIRLLSALKGDDSDYVRKSAGNALRDISRQHADLIRAELDTWNRADKRVKQVHQLAGKLLSDPL